MTGAPQDRTPHLSHRDGAIEMRRTDKQQMFRQGREREGLCGDEKEREIEREGRGRGLERFKIIKEGGNPWRD